MYSSLAVTTAPAPNIPAQRDPARPPHGHSRPDCAQCQSLRATLVASYDTPEEGTSWNAWVSHMNTLHPGWRRQPTFPQSV